MVGVGIAELLRYTCGGITSFNSGCAGGVLEGRLYGEYQGLRGVGL